MLVSTSMVLRPGQDKCKVAGTRDLLSSTGGLSVSAPCRVVEVDPSMMDPNGETRWSSPVAADVSFDRAYVKHTEGYAQLNAGISAMSVSRHERLK